MSTGMVIIENWTWHPYDDHGPWDAQLTSKPTHGWRRIVDLIVASVEYRLTEWQFGTTHPDKVTAGEVIQFHADRQVAEDLVA